MSPVTAHTVTALNANLFLGDPANLLHMQKLRSKRYQRTTHEENSQVRSGKAEGLSVHVQQPTQKLLGSEPVPFLRVPGGRFRPHAHPHSESKRNSKLQHAPRQLPCVAKVPGLSEPLTTYIRKSEIRKVQISASSPSRRQSSHRALLPAGKPFKSSAIPRTEQPPLLYLDKVITRCNLHR